MVQLLKHYAANCKVVDSNPADTCVCRICFPGQSSLIYMSQVWPVLRLNNSTALKWVITLSFILASWPPGPWVHIHIHYQLYLLFQDSLLLVCYENIKEDSLNYVDPSINGQNPTGHNPTQTKPHLDKTF